MSIILTMNLWSYSPIADKSGRQVKVLLSEKKDIKEIVRIEQIIFNLEGNYYGTLSTEKIDNLMKAVSSWEFSSFNNLSLDEMDIDVKRKAMILCRLFIPGKYQWSYLHPSIN